MRSRSVEHAGGSRGNPGPDAACPPGRRGAVRRFALLSVARPEATPYVLLSPMRVLALGALLFPLLSAAQGLTLRPPSIGEAIDTMHRSDALKDQKGLEQTFILPERPGQNQ